MFPCGNICLPNFASNTFQFEVFEIDPINYNTISIHNPNAIAIDPNYSSNRFVIVQNVSLLLLSHAKRCDSLL